MQERQTENNTRPSSAEIWLKSGLKGAQRAATWTTGKAVDVAKGGARITLEAADWKRNTSTKPILFHANENNDVVIVSIPFTIVDTAGDAATRKNIRACTSGYAFRHPNQPALLLQFVDPYPKANGDEALAIVPVGPARDLFGSEPVRWELYGNWSSVHGIGKPLNKPLADCTAADVVDSLVSQLAEASSGCLEVRPHHLLDGLDLISKKTKRFEERWKLLDKRLEFMRLRAKDPELMASIIVSMCEAENKDDLIEFGRQQINGELLTLSQTTEAMDKIEGLRLTGGAAVVAKWIIGALEIKPSDHVLAQIEAKFSPSHFMGFLSLTYINRLVKLYLGEIKPRVLPRRTSGIVDLIEDIADKQFKNQWEVVGIAQDILDIRLGHLKDRRRFLTSWQKRGPLGILPGPLKGEAKTWADGLIEQLKSNIDESLGDTLTETPPPALPAPEEPHEIKRFPFRKN